MIATTQASPRVYGHGRRYPLAYQPMFDKALSIARATGDPAVLERVGEDIAKLMEEPIYQYRPVPRARAFHRSPKRFRWLLGGNRCLGPDQVVPSPDGPRKVSEIAGRHKVYAWDGRQVVVALADEPFVKGLEECYRLLLSNGQTVDCSAKHRVLTADGVYEEIGSLLESAGVPLPSSSGICPQALLAGAARSTSTASGSRCGCLRGSRSSGGPPRPAEGIGQGEPPSPAGAETHICSGASSRRDALGSTPECNRPWPEARPLSIADAPPHHEAPCAGIECRAGRTPSKSSAPHSEAARRSMPASCPPRSSLESAPPAISDAARGSGSPGAWPGRTASAGRERMPASSQAAERSPDTAAFLDAATPPVHLSSPVPLSSPYGYVAIIAVAGIGVKPVYDFTVSRWHNYLAAGVVHHNSGKSSALAHEIFWCITLTHPFREDFRKPPRKNLGKDIATPVCWAATLTWEMVGEVIWPNLARLIECYDPGKDYTVRWHNRAAQIPAELEFRLMEPGTGVRYKSRLVFKAYEQGADAFQGTERRAIFFDEQFGQDIWVECVTRVGAGQPLDVAASLTPIKPQAWLEEAIRERAGKEWDVFEMPLDDNRLSRGGFIDDERIDAMIDEWPEEVVPTRRLGRFGSFLGAVYKSFSRQVHVVPAAREAQFFPRVHSGRHVPGLDMQVIGGIDWGGANPFVFLWATRIPHMDNAWYVFDELYWRNDLGQRLIRDHAEVIKKRTSDWQTRFVRVWADHDATDRFEMQNAGIGTLAADKDVHMGIEAVQKALKVHEYGGRKQPHLFIAERCENTIRELAGYRWPSASKTRDPQELPVKQDDHSADVVRYLVRSEESALPRGPRVTIEGARRIFQ